MRFIGRTLSIGQIALASFLGYAFSSNIGLSMLAGASVHERFSGGGVEAVRFEKGGGLTIWAAWAGAEYPGNDPLASRRGRVFTLEGLAESDTVTALDLHGRLLAVDREGGLVRLETGGSPRYLLVQGTGE